jgi:aminoglycoside phosphotransferase (APT) family kinase protein
MGGMNYHIEIQFEDGISWLARIRRVNATSPPADLQAYIMRSEVATLQFLRSKTKVPVAEVYDYNLDEKNPIGVEYILMEKLAGQSLC